MLYDDVFLCIDNIFIISSLAFAMQERKGNPSYTFCIISQQEIKPHEKKAIEDFNGKILHTTDLSKEKLSAITVNMHSFGEEGWQRSVLGFINYQKRGVYTDFLKNGWPSDIFSDVAPLSRRIYFGFIIRVKNEDDLLAHVVELPNCFDAFSYIAARHPHVESLESIDLGEEPINIIFLRYWGKGAYVFNDGIEYKDAVFSYIKEIESHKFYIKSDPRISKEELTSTIDFLSERGYEIKDFGDIFSLPRDICNDIPAEFLLEKLRGQNISAITFDSSISISLKYLNNAKIFFPDKHAVCDLFADSFARELIEVTCDIYSKVCCNIESVDDKSALSNMIINI